MTATSFNTYADYAAANARDGFQCIPQTLWTSLKLNLADRETQFNDAEFDLIERNAEGRIIDDFDLIWCFLSDAQKSMLHGDDQSRGDDVDEELRVMMAEFL